MGFAVQSVFDVALWFLDRARAEDGYLPPQKLQRLLFLAQSHYALERDGENLMPAVFVTGLHGPMEPNVVRAFEHGRPNVLPCEMAEETDEFLYGVWRRFAHLNVEHLNQLVAGISGCDQVLVAGEGSEIPMQTIYRTLRGKKPIRLGVHNGKPIRRWVPGVKPATQ
ncbi:MAG: hypothetical protein AB1781_01265 [Pseudomonadota bacterium]